MSKKPLTKIFVAAFILIIGIFLNSQLARLQLAFGWTNPNSGPPNATANITVLNNGNVGIGTTNPISKLEVVGTAQITGLVSCDTIDSDSSGNLFCGIDSNGSIGGSGLTNYLVKFINSSTLGNSLLYESNNNIGVGTTTPRIAKLTIDGDLSLPSANNITNECALPTYVGSTANSYDGDVSVFGEKWDPADAICAKEYGGPAHVCNGEDLQRSYRCSASPPSNVWFNTNAYSQGKDSISGAAIYVYDCYYWSSNNSGTGGSIWLGGSVNCSRSYKFSCCK